MAGNIKNTVVIVAGVGLSLISSAASIVATHEHDQKVLKEEKKKSFEHGVRVGVGIADEIDREMAENILMAWVASAYYIASVDGKISSAERRLIDKKLKSILDETNVSDEVRDKILSIGSKELKDFDYAKNYLNKVPTGIILSFISDMYDIAKSTGGVSAIEEEGIQKLLNYAELGDSEVYRKGKCDNPLFTITDAEKNRYYQSLAEPRIEQEVTDYTVKMKMLDWAFQCKTKLNKNEVVLLFAAVALQEIRLVVINKLTEVEKAGNNNKKEIFLHEKQKEILKKLGVSEKENPRKYYAPMRQIVTTVGVPYDVQAYKGENLGLFKGANHRFATLGHDPLIGLFIGTANIMTNTITVVKNESHIPVTYHVKYNSNYKDGKITGEVASILYALTTISDRCSEDIKPLVASFIKQLIHIATDLYTPAGIQLPGANLVLSNGLVEKITAFVSAGDVIKISASAGIADIVNKLIEILYGCFLAENNESELDNEINKVKLKKIILYSNTIASSSSVMQAIITNNVRDLDIGGVLVLVNKMFSDVNFIYDIKNEFISKGLGEC